MLLAIFNLWKPEKGWKEKYTSRTEWKTTRLNNVFVNDFSIGKFFFFLTDECVAAFDGKRLEGKI